LTDKSKQNT